MTKIKFRIIALFFSSLYLASPYILPVHAQDAPNINVTKRRPDRPVGYSPLPTPSSSTGLSQPEVKQVQTSQPSFFTDLWGRIKSFFANIFKLPSASTTHALPSPSPTGPAINWDTYTNQVHGYTLKYPSTWIIDSQRASLPDNAELKITTTSSTASIYVIAAMDGLGGLVKNVPTEPINFIGKTYYKQYNGINSSDRTQTITIDETPSGLGIFEHNNKVYSIQLVYLANAEGDLPTADIATVFDQVLASFQFVN